MKRCLALALLCAACAGPAQETALDDPLGGKPAAPQTVSLLREPLYAPNLAPERQAELEANLEAAWKEYLEDPRSEERIIWVGRRLAYLGRYRAAIEVYTRGLELHPQSYRLLRHRGHRHITLRELEAEGLL